MLKTAENTIAFQGIHGANSDMACRKAYPYMETAPFPSFEDVFDAVESGEAALGMIPIENSQAGRVAEIHNLLPRTNVHIVGEHFQPVEHQLMAPKGAKLKDIKTVYSHPQALMQCRNNLRALNVETVAHSNTAAAAADVAKWNDPTKAAIASGLAAELYGLEILKPNLQDADDNFSIFLAISREPIEPKPEAERTLTTLLFTVRNIPAALYKALGGFATNGVNMLKLESYISVHSTETAQFFVTIQGHPQERKVQLALEELGFFCKKVKVLGTYPADPARVL